MVYLIVKLNQSVTAGGFAEFYETSFGVFAPEIIHVLNEIKSVETSGIVSNTLTIVNPTGLLDEAYKEFVFNIHHLEITCLTRLRILDGAQCRYRILSQLSQGHRQQLILGMHQGHRVQYPALQA